MAASYRHRKLLVNLNPSNDTALYPFCLYDCNPEVNPAGICSADCSLYCPNFCRPFEPSSPTPAPTISPHAITPPDHHNLLLSLPLKISLIFLTATFVYTVYKFYTVWYRSGTSRPQPPSSPENENFEEQDVLDHPIWYIRTVGLPAAVINALTVVNFSKIDGTVEGSDCSVCLTEFEEDDTLRLLPNCKHAFHVRCIDTWLRSHTNCPLCRAVIVENNNNNTTSLEQNDGGLGETNLGVSDGDRGEASGSSGLDEDLFKIEGNGAL